MHQPIRWRPLGTQEWKDGILIDGLNGNYAIQLPGGAYLTTDRNGTTNATSVMGPWEGNYQVNTTSPTVRITPNVVTYVYEIVEV